jgi:uncharacterized membrane protein
MLPTLPGPLLDVVGGYNVIITVVFTVVVMPLVIVAVCVAVPDFRRLLQSKSASEVCPTKESNPHCETE